MHAVDANSNYYILTECVQKAYNLYSLHHHSMQCVHMLNCVQCMAHHAAQLLHLQCREGKPSCNNCSTTQCIPYALKFSRDETFAVFAVRKTTANSLVREYFEQVLRNRKKMDAERILAPLSPLLDRKYKYERRFV